MSSKLTERLGRLLGLIYLLFIFGSTFSIALAQSALGISLLLFIVVAFLEKYNPFQGPVKIVYISILAYVGWLWIASFVNDNSYNSFVGTREEWLFSAIPIGIYLVQKKHMRRFFLISLSAGVLFVSIYGIIQHFTGVILLKDYLAVKAPDFGYMVSGQFSHRLTFGNYFGLMSVFLFGVVAGQPDLRKDRICLIVLLAAIMGTIVTILSYSRGPIFSVVFVLLVSGFIAGRRLFRIGVPALVMLVVALTILQPNLIGGFKQRFDRDLNNEYSGSRTFIWKTSSEIIRENLWFGVGPANFKQAYRDHLPVDTSPSRQHSHAHNDLLNFAAISGIPGSILWLFLFLVISLMLYRAGGDKNIDESARAWSRAALLATLFFFAASMTEAVFADEEVRQGLMFIWAAGLATFPVRGTETSNESKKA